MHFNKEYFSGVVVENVPNCFEKEDDFFVFNVVS